LHDDVQVSNSTYTKVKTI